MNSVAFDILIKILESYDLRTQQEIEDKVVVNV